MPLDIYIDYHASLVELEDPGNTVTVHNSPCVAVLSHEKWIAVRRKRNENKKAVGSIQLVGKSLVNSHSDSP